LSKKEGATFGLPLSLFHLFFIGLCPVNYRQPVIFNKTPQNWNCHRKKKPLPPPGQKRNLTTPSRDSLLRNEGILETPLLLRLSGSLQKDAHIFDIGIRKSAFVPPEAKDWNNGMM